MIFAARQLLTQFLTVSAVNAQLAALQTAYGGNWPQTPNVNTVLDGTQYALTDAVSSPPSLLYMVGLKSAAEVELKRVQKSDSKGLPITIYYVSSGTFNGAVQTQAQAWNDAAITFEAVEIVLESMEGQQLGTTGRGCIMVGDWRIEMVVIDAGDDNIAQYGFRATSALVMRTMR